MRLGSGSQLVLAPEDHQVRLNIGQASCALLWGDAGGIALCTEPVAGSLPSPVAATVARCFERERVAGP
ncbi:MAG: hypothetical protein C5B48_10120 [Candidatus Rokuibacteriota bacterium]|nr:MAG: hypothetical protein C5B48_10120 [Candidatus Rokubacteria bacterium]